jgi:CDP-glucose 4,6-dehydratase
MSFVSPLGAAYKGKRVFVTGHTGFKGSWLCEWLLHLGAEVAGFSLEPEEGALFRELGLETRLAHQLGDIRDRALLADAIRGFHPDHVFHLAAQPLVLASYDRPLETFETNVNGTLNLLEALRPLQSPCAVVCVTTDKCYENREWLQGYRETDKLGGNDPYSASKAMAELGIASCRRSFFGGSPVRIASARAGNVLGGGDWAADRIVPDAIRALKAGAEVPVRNPKSTRPWQHVLEPLGGYLLLGARLLGSSGADFCTAFNFGPWTDSNRSVRELVEEILKHWPGEWADTSDGASPHEAHLLHLSIDKAYHMLGWSPVWDFAQTVTKTVEGYRSKSVASQIDEYTRDSALP